jgi:hypothetical protein
MVQGNGTREWYNFLWSMVQVYGTRGLGSMVQVYGTRGLGSMVQVYGTSIWYKWAKV